MMDPYDHVDVWLNAVQDLLGFYMANAILTYGLRTWRRC